MTAAFPAPLFVLGNPRSGTTLLRLMLTCHPRIAIPPECGFALWLLPRFESWTATQTADAAAVEEFVAAVLATRKFETWGLAAADLVQAIRRREPVTYAELVDAVYGAWLDSRGRTGCRWGDKNNFYLHHVAEIRVLFPDAILVHIVRDGRDVACSYAELAGRTVASEYAPRLPSDLADIALDWVDNVSLLRRSFEALDWKGVVELRYEDLVTRPKETLTAVLASFGETFDVSMLDYATRNAREQLEPAEFLQWKARTTSAPDAERIGRFRRELTPDQIEVLNTKMGPLLSRYGYAPG